VKFSDAFEDRFVRQGEYENRTIEESLRIGWDLLAMLPPNLLKRIRDEFIERYYPKTS
jgi:V/A-type H+-transporting ATPase subunit B